MPREPQIPFEQSVYRAVEHPIPVRGVAPDLPQESIGDTFLASASNFLVRNGRPHRREGTTTRYPTNATALSDGNTLYSLFEFTSTRAPASSLIVGLFGASFRYAASTSTAWTTITGSVSVTPGPFLWTTYITASAGQELIGTGLTAGESAVRWTGSTASTFTALGTAVTGTCITSWRNHLLLGNTTDTADGSIVTRIHWSALGDPTTWSGTASAGSIDLNDSNATRVLNLVPLRTTLVAYKEEAAHALIYKTAPFYFTQTLLHPTISLVAPRAVTPIDSGTWHFLLTKEGAVLWDGQTIRPIGRNRVDRTILQSINWAARDQIWAQWWGLREEVLLAIPTGASTTPNVMWVYNQTYDAWWELDIPSLTAIPAYYAATTPTLVGSRFVSGENDAYNAWQLFTGDVDGLDATPIESSLQTGLFSYGAIEHKRLLKLAVLAGPASGTTATLSISKAGQENPVATPSFASAQSITVTGGAELQKIDFSLTDRWIAYRITHTASGETCEITSIVPSVMERTDSRKRR